MTPKLGAALVAVGLAATPQPGFAEGRPDFAQSVEIATRLYAVLALRSVMDFTYQAISTDPVTGETSLTGLTFWPKLETGSEGRCRIDVGRALLGGSVLRDRFGMTVEATDVTVGQACFDPATASTLLQFGYADLKSDMAVLSLTYDLPTGGTDVTLQAGVTDAVTLNLTASFDYLWATGFLDSETPDASDEFVPYAEAEPPAEIPAEPLPEAGTDGATGAEDPPAEPMPESFATDSFESEAPASAAIPSALLRRAELSLENRGLWDRVKPMVGGMVGTPEALPAMAEAGLLGFLSENGSRVPGPEEEAFVKSLAAALGGFLKEEKRLTLTVAPPQPVWLRPEEMTAPFEVITALTPVVSTGAPAIAAVLPPDLIAAAMSGATMAEADRLAVGRALMTGFGAPRDRKTAIATLQPLADAGNATAAMVLAEGLSAAGEDQAAYAQVLVALSGNAPGALLLADRLETRLTAAVVRDAQAAALKAWPADPGLAARSAALLSGADPAAMRALALDARLGRNMPRNYEAAWLWASLAAAGGDQVAAHLVTGLEARAGDAVWRAVFDAASAVSLRLWADGLGATLHARSPAR